MSTTRRQTIYNSTLSRPNPEILSEEITPLKETTAKTKEVASSLSTLALSFDSIRPLEKSSNYPAASQSKLKQKLSWLSGVNTDSLYTIDDERRVVSLEKEASEDLTDNHEATLNFERPSIASENKFRNASNGANLEKPKKAVDPAAQISWSSIRQSQLENQHQSSTTSSQLYSHLPSAKYKDKEELSNLKRWPNLDANHYRKISGASEYNDAFTSTIDSSISLNLVSNNNSAQSITNSDSGSSGYSSNSTQIEDSKSRTASIGEFNENLTSATVPENLQHPYWVDNEPKNLLKGDTNAQVFTASKQSFSAHLPSLDETNEDSSEDAEAICLAASRIIPLHQQLLINTKTPIKAQPSLHGISHWKLPPLLKKMVYGGVQEAVTNQQSVSTKPATPSNFSAAAKKVPPPLPVKPNSSGSKIPIPALLQTPPKSYRPIPIAGMSKPSTANTLLHAVKQMTNTLGKTRVASDPGISKVSGLLLSSVQVARKEGTTVGASSKTLADPGDNWPDLLGTVWVNEDMARAEEARMGLNDVECFEAAKIRFDTKYKLQKQLGAGGHSTVRLARRVYDSELVVCKFIKQQSVWHWYTCPTTLRQHPLEIQVMRKFSKLNNGKGHSNFINYYEHFEMDAKFTIVMEYMGENWVDLYDYIEMYGPVKEEISLEIFKSIVETLVLLHELGYYHNDIKDENVLIHSKTRQIKLIDFGSATLVPSPDSKTPNLCENFYGTKKFAAPEAVQGDPYNPEMQESWALGTLLFVLLFKLDPFTSDEEILNTDIVKRIAKFRNVAKNTTNNKAKEAVFIADKELTGVLGDISDLAVEALVAMMEKDPVKRVRVKDILKLPALKVKRKVI
ncbi:hypothetical protein HK100_005780 [Physocladia obscura]|uniref:Protein kinase domain-containing protein n=1 Tax=Physocladia obscura TaxID=109957 RepID=A0AAD5XGC4_9FUNG|nr:hypothetical protein HK100_005780 [Physocladia obscura]